MGIQTEEISIPTPLGHPLAVTKFIPEKAHNYTIVISSATGVLQKYYSKFAHFFATNGFCVYTFDYHGIGKSQGSTAALKGNRSDLIDWGQNDQATVVAMAKKENPGSKLIMITHSIGGQILGFNANYHMLDSVILVASQGGYWKDFKGIHKPKMWLFWYVLIPFLTPIFGYFPAKKLGLFENLPKHMVKQWGGWGKKQAYFMHYYNAEQFLFDKFEIPVLSLSFSKDQYAPKATVDWLGKQYKNAAVQRVHHQAKKEERHLKHFGFFKSWAQEPYWGKCLNYILNGSYES